ncbi:hypothetical protein PTSG_02326 [Salpingoeca rosetta]|uniref:Actin n=1 Tax=Salpingoeca rosetta (strain ATCC 50818 / BSB-021) TaxID=946362 RepID=F2U1V8_SALR5|nr:uncharacterized protein PTSG_02326 [Salpingoeca rosetta]EGD81610.1 hypothetical protein PTSG_02326 [Salpingoeca rosetta]|eukprot:XP_004996814.1 hypothetical protein PTSG_02326 [Salpingoeca rosetta]
MSSSPSPAQSPPWWVLDNGSGTLKASVVHQSPQANSPNSNTAVTLENAVLAGSGGRRQGFSDDFEDLSRLYWSRPCEQEFVTDHAQEAHIWRHLQHKLQVPEAAAMLCSSALTSFAPVNDGLAEIAFEELGCSSFCLLEAPALASYALPGDCQLIVDSGFSSTRVCAVHRHCVVPGSVVRMPVGGRVITNYLKDLVSYRHVNVSDQQQLVEELKLHTLRIVDNFAASLTQAKRKTPKDNPFMLDYLLPDYAGRMHGHVLPREDMKPVLPKPTVGRQVIRLTNETFSPGELFFHPNDIGIDSVGVQECIAASLQRCPEWLQPSLVQSIVLIGGNANIPGFRRRLEAELRSCLPQDLGAAHITLPNDPQHAVWRGGCALAADTEAISALAVSRATFAEHGTLSPPDTS